MHYTSKDVYEFISKKTNDPIIERKTCEVSWEEFAIFQSDLEFYNKISPVIWGTKYQIPLPKLCPEERERKRCIFKNNEKLYRGTCDKTGKKIVSLYAPDPMIDKNWTINTKYTIYDQKIWRANDRDAIDYWRELNLSKSFMDQFNDLFITVPKASMINDNGTVSENCEYCQDFSYGKNCYLLYSSWKVENCYYGFHVLDNSKDLIDCDEIINSQNCYSCIDCDKCYSSLYCTNCFDCSFCIQSSNLKWCSYCIGCSNLTNKQYYIDNKPSTKEEYNKIVNTQERQNFLAKKDIYKNLYNINCTWCRWNNNFTWKNSCFVFDNKWIEDSKYSIWWTDTKWCYDITMTWAPEHSYNSITCDEGFGIYCSIFCRKCSNVFYSDFCHGCQNCFGCTWLRNKQYCILNKQYTKNEYEKLVPQIIKNMKSEWTWWDFFRTDISPFWYNETFSQEYYPLSREDAIEKWYKLMEKEYSINVPDSIKIVQWAETSNLTDEEILKIAIKCSISSKTFRILKPELTFYRKHNLNLPTKHPDIRHAERLKQRPSRKLNVRNCDKCSIEMLSVYSKDYEWKVYCEECYQKEVYF